MTNKILLLILFSLIAASCTQSVYVRKNQSHFDFPNSNIVPIGNSTVTGITSTKLSFNPPTMTSVIEEKAYQDALGKVQGADMLIDIDYHWSITVYPLYITTLYAGKLTVEGFPVSMEIGEQELN